MPHKVSFSWFTNCHETPPPLIETIVSPSWVLLNDATRASPVAMLEGKVSRGGWVKLFRGKEQIFEGRISSLKHFKEDVREMPAGQECGIGLEGYEAFVPADTMETYRLEREEI